MIDIGGRNGRVNKVKTIIGINESGAKILCAQYPSVANAIKLLQVCMYKSVNTGQFLTSLVATCIVKFMLLMLDS